jgi:RND family efflux transporter MFP subunit
MSFNAKRYLAIALILLVSLGGAGLLVAQKKPPEAEPIEDIATLVDVLDLVPTRVRFSVSSQGTVQPVVTTELVAEVSGPIISISDSFTAGGVFAANETLLQIDPVIYQAAVTQTEAILKQRQIEYDGIKRLDAQNYRSKIDLAAAEAALASAQADLVRARRDLDKTRVRLPYDGIVRAKVADVGQFVNAGTRLGTTFGTALAQVRLPLSQNDQRFLNLPEAGSAGTLESPLPVTLSGRYRGRDATWLAHIVRTEGVIDETNRVTYAVAQITDPYRRLDDSPQSTPLPVGTFAGAQIAGLYVDNVLEVPRSALRGNGQLLFVDDESQLRLRTVDVIRSDADTAFVAASSVADRRLVLTTMESPVNGQQVRIAGDDGDVVAPPNSEAAASD